MAFIDKKDSTVLNIKLTSKGRELLSKGKLNFTYYAIGDSEIDYEFNRNAEFEAFNANILRPKDKNPKQLSFIPKNLSGDPYNEISSVPSTPSTIINQVQPIGFFNNDATKFLTDGDHVKQPDAAVAISGMSGGTTLNLIQAPTYQANVNEPKIGDILLIKWTNPLGIDTTGYDVNITNPTPYLWYKIQNIISGSLQGNNLIIEVDRDLPDFTNITGGSNNILAGAMIFYNYDNFNGSNDYSTDNTDDALISFLQNCECPTVTFPFWNMSIVFTDDIVGIDLENDDKRYYDYYSNAFAGFVSYIQNQRKYDKSYEYKYNLGIIHYTNNSVSNTYGEGFYGDPLNPQHATDIPTLDIPIIMWHKSSDMTMGLQLKASGQLKYLTGATRFLNARYYDLADPMGNVVGKVFYDLQIFLIEDQELLFAMSYKSNRSWTLPEHNTDINANISFGCAQCLLNYTLSGITPTTIGSDDGQIKIHNIINSSLDQPNTSLILKITDNNDNVVYFSEITGETTITKDDTIGDAKLYAGDYYVELIDTGFADCISGKTVTIPAISSKLAVIEEDTTYSALNSYFNITPVNENPTHIRFYDDNANSIGYPFGTAYITIGPVGMTNNDLQNRFNNGEGTTGDDALGGSPSIGKWVAIPNNGSLDVTNLTFKEQYQIFIRDATGDTFNEINQSYVINSQIWTYYIAAGNPFNNASNINTTEGYDTNGRYIAISNYVNTPLDNNKNPIVGDIEISLFKSTELPENWYNTSNDGSTVKIYINSMPTGTYNIQIREKYNFIIMYNVTINNTFTIS